MTESSRLAELARLRTEVLRYRANLVDLSTRLPTLPLVLDQVRKLLDGKDVLQVFLVSLEQEQNLEQVVGWERYDALLACMADHLRSLLVDGPGSQSLLCQEAVRGDSFLVFCFDREDGAHLLGRLVEGLAVPDEDSGTSLILPVRVGKGTIRRHPTQRVERCVYGGVLEARRDYNRRGAELDERRRDEVQRMLRDRRVQTLFQPIVRLPGREIEGYEALSRGPAGSYLEGAENLFGFTERAGFLGEVELLCIEMALENSRRLDPDVVLFLNLSIHGLNYLETEGVGLVETVHRAGLKAEQIVLEITERTYADNPELLKSWVYDIRRKGFRIAIDDMGTGYSALHLVADLEPDFIKLDQMLVRELALSPIKQNLVSAVIRFARDSRARVIAEGVEHADEAQVLADLGVDLVQGYFFGVPRAV